MDPWFDLRHTEGGVSGPFLTTKKVQFREDENTFS